MFPNHPTNFSQLTVEGKKANNKPSRAGLCTGRKTQPVRRDPRNTLKVRQRRGRLQEDRKYGEGWAGQDLRGAATGSDSISVSLSEGLAKAARADSTEIPSAH